MKQSDYRYEIGDIVKITNKRTDDLGKRWPENTVCVVTDTPYIDGAEDNFVRLMAIHGNDGKIQYNYYIDEVSPYPSNADMISRMNDREMAEFLLNWLRSPYGGEIIE